MYRLAIAAIVLAIAVALVALLLRSVLSRVDAEVSGPVTDNGGPMPRIAFFLLLCVMVYAISTGAS